MAETPPGEVTELLLNWSRGDRAALDQLVPLVHDELHRRAHYYMQRERPGPTLQTSALVNEVYLGLVDQQKVNWQNRAHFLAVAAQLMRQILVDYARRRQSAKRGGKAVKVSLEEAAIVTRERGEDLVAVDNALKALAAIDPRKSQLVELRFFGGLSVKETAEVLKVSPRTVMREWDLAQAWLHRELAK